MSLSVPSLAILDGIDVPAPGRSCSGQEGRATRVKSQAGRWTRRGSHFKNPRTLHGPPGPAEPGWDSLGVAP
ncbi:hypothetical protein V1290_000142 [Bradyrhizobium sp. AZCC 1578]